MEKKKIDLNASGANSQTAYFSEHPELFEYQSDKKGTIYWIIAAIVCGIIAYIFWFRPDIIQSLFGGDTSISQYKQAKFWTYMEILKWVASIGALLSGIVLLFGGAKKIIHRSTGGEVNLDVFVKHIYKDQTNLKELFENDEYETILSLPSIDTYNTGIGEYSTFRLAEDSTGKTYFAFLEYRHDESTIEGTVKHENLPPKVISGEAYSRLHARIANTPKE